MSGNGHDWSEIQPGVNLLAVARTFFHVEQGVPTPDGSLVRCFLAGHDDRSPSLHLRYKGRSNAEHRYYCFGCHKKGDAAQLLIDGGLATSFNNAIKMIVDAHLAGVVAQPLSALPYSNGGHGARQQLRDRRVEATFIYRDASGMPLLQVERIVGVDENGERDKTFRQSHRWENGCCPTCSRIYKGLVRSAEEERWEPGRLQEICVKRGYAFAPSGGEVLAHPGEVRYGGLPRELLVPYRLPELLQESGAVFFVEGEKKADAVRDILGFTATSAPGGGTAVLPKAWAEYFRKARSVIIVPDCDPTGRDICAKPRAALLREAGIRVEIFDLDPSRNDAYDIYDWITEQASKGLDREGMREALRSLRAAHLTRTP